MIKNVFRKSLVIGTIVLFLGASVGAGVITNVGSEKIELEIRNLSTSTRQDIIYVNNDYNETTPTWNVTHFDNIQAGVNAVNEHGTVYVCNGTYYENVNITKSLDLIGIDEDYLWGTDSNGSIIDSGGVGNVIDIRASYVTVTGFTIQNSGSGTLDSGVHIYISNSICVSKNNIYSCRISVYTFISKDLNISNNTITGPGKIGIYFFERCNGLIEYNKISLFAIGIDITRAGAKIKNNRIFKNGRDTLFDWATAIGLFSPGEIDIKHNAIYSNGCNFIFSLAYISKGHIKHNNIEAWTGNKAVKADVCIVSAPHNWWGSESGLSFFDVKWRGLFWWICASDHRWDFPLP